MRAVIFTMDSVFALTIAVASITILLYFAYSSPAQYPIRYSEAAGIVSTLLSTSVGQLQNSSPVASQIASQSAGVNETWTQFMNGAQAQGHNGRAPSSALVSYVFTATGSVTTGVVADYGNIYFVAGTTLYAVNATEGVQAWSRSVGAGVTGTPLLYGGMVIYATSTSIASVSARTGSLIWSTSLPSQATSAVYAYDGKALIGTADGRARTFYTANGTASWSYPFGSSPVSFAPVQGSIALTNSSGGVALLVASGSAAGELWGKPASSATYISSSGPVIYFGQGQSANAVYSNGTTVTGFPVSLGSGEAASGVAVTGNRVIYQSTSEVMAVTPSGGALWSTLIPDYFGSASADAMPVTSDGGVYTLWSGGVAMLNLSTGKVVWYSAIPYASPSQSLSIAYGKLFVVSGSRVIAFGSCGASSSDSLLQAAADMYQNGFGGCADSLLSSVRGRYNYSVFVGDSLGPAMHLASFDGAAGYVSVPNSNSLNTSLVSVSFWMNASAYPTSGARIVNYGDNDTSTSAYSGWFFYLAPDGHVTFSVMNHTAQMSITPANAVKLNTWYLVTGTFDGGYLRFYLNGNLVRSLRASASINPPPPAVSLTIGTGLPSDGRYFKGSIADLQTYYFPLSASQIAGLYRSGIEAPPPSGANATSWYPLDGDANDYSINGNAGYSFGVSYGLARYLPVSLSNTYEVSRAGVPLYVRNFTAGTVSLQYVGVYSWS